MPSEKAFHLRAGVKPERGIALMRCEVVREMLDTPHDMREFPFHIIALGAEHEISACHHGVEYAVAEAVRARQQVYDLRPVGETEGVPKELLTVYPRIYQQQVGLCGALIKPVRKDCLEPEGPPKLIKQGVDAVRESLVRIKNRRGEYSLNHFS